MCGFKNFDLRAGHVLRLTSCFEHGQREQETKKKSVALPPPLFHTYPTPFSPPTPVLPPPLSACHVFFSQHRKVSGLGQN